MNAIEIKTTKSAYLAVYDAMNEKLRIEKTKKKLTKRQALQIDVFKNSVLCELFFNLDKEQLTE